MPPRIGIPSSLLYHLYYPSWQVFFRKLGCEVLTSGQTTKEIVDQGVKEALADACVPIKIYFGHVLALKDKVDFLFVPRVVCLNGSTTYCPKFLGLPDMIRHSLTDLPPLLMPRLDVREGRLALWKAFLNLAEQVGVTCYRKVLASYWTAQRLQARFFHLLTRGFLVPEALRLCLKEETPGRKRGLRSRSQEGDIRVAVLGYPYAVYDSYISFGILTKLRRLGAEILTAENIPLSTLLREEGLDKRLFWTFSDIVIQAAHYVVNRRLVDGIIHLTAFGCGPDSLVDKFMEIFTRERTVPFMTATIDEHSGEAGIVTRLEAFVDMLRRRPKEMVSGG